MLLIKRQRRSVHEKIQNVASEQKKYLSEQRKNTTVASEHSIQIQLKPPQNRLE